MGGAMDLVTGSKKVIIAMTHSAKDGSAKILKAINLPTTAVQKVDLIITELAVIEVTNAGLLLKEISKDTTIEEVKIKTDADLMVSDYLVKF